jgi:hypothetical protein
MQNMEESSHANMRSKARFNVTLKATYITREQGAQHQVCQSNLRSSGATARFPNNARSKSGAVIARDIAIPNTFMRIATEAEVMWTKKHFNELIRVGRQKGKQEPEHPRGKISWFNVDFGCSDVRSGFG